MCNYKNIILSLSVLAASFGCSEHCGDDISTCNFGYKDVIGFNANELFSKANMVNGSTFDNFAVFANYIVPGGSLEDAPLNFFYNKIVNKESGNWKYSPQAYWPTSGMLSFFAYSPYSEYESGRLKILQGHEDKGAPAFRYDLDNNFAEHTDLMLATPVLNVCKDNVNEDGKLNLRFNHVLSAVEISARVLQPCDYDIVVSKVEFLGLHSGGNLLFDGSKYEWQNVDDSESVNYILNKENVLKNVSISNDITPVNICTQDVAFMVVPQLVKENFTVGVEVYYFLNGNLLEPQIMKTAVDMSLLIPLYEAGKKYCLNVVVAGYADISLSCSVVPWSTQLVEVPDFKAESF